jgi:Lipopolysaccharide-assembly
VSKNDLKNTERLRSSAIWFLILFTLAAVTGGCRGYHLGNQYSFRNDIRTVHVAMAESDSYRPFQGQQLTEAIVKQIESQTPYTITEPALADSILRTRLMRESKRVAGENRFDDARTVEYGWQLEVTWVDRSGVPLMSRQVLYVNDDSTFIPEGGQSLGSAQTALVVNLARQIVGQMEAAW